jgi:hypothetical protein
MDEKQTILRCWKWRKKMKQNGMEITSIAEYTGLPVDVILNLCK